ncbi:DNA internalization-related competence protein ComEC/Rec2 [Dokdonella ginsengisoli]|uniref:DNA internalization-related competence protein ComEC/Rec2 n=1 Tax=Dokdonella ginsengisoli TaxID=363846 RepID=A0ABV9QUG9_9GAMM
MGRKPAGIGLASPPFGVATALAALLGALAVHALPALPPRWLDAALAVLAAALLLRPRLRLPGCVLLGFAWCALRADVALEARLPRELEGRDFTVVGTVEDLPKRQPDATRFELRVERARLDGRELALQGRLRLSWYDGAPQELDACSRWQLQLRLRRPRGLVNRGGFDSERHALEHGIVAVGYVREADSNRRLGERGGCVDRLRERLAHDIAERVGDPHDAALVRAFAIGDTRGLGPDDWEVARATGVSHLIAISGFHVGIAAGFGALLVRLLWRLWPRLGLRVAVPVAQAPVALVTALAYGALAGNSLPTLRTLMMIAIVALAHGARRGSGGAHALALALLAILVIDPLATLSAGFWLSFVGVAFLLGCLARGRGWTGWLRELGAGQLLMSVALLPLTVWFFGEVSLVGVLSNLFAVPVVSVVIVPLCLLGLLALLTLPVVAVLPLTLAATIAHAQWRLLESMAGWPGAHGYLPEVAPWALALAMLGAAWMFLPRGVPARGLGALLFLPLLLPDRPPPPQGAFVATVIDVGQGLSVLVRTHGHALLYDAGARYRSEFDLGEAAVLPTLHALGIDTLDAFVVSHGDNDHAGGAPAVARAYPQARRYAGEPARLDLGAAQCRSGQAWRWDGVDFRMLGPRPEALAAHSGSADNDRSCVLLVETASGRLLLTGDVSRRVEPAIAAAAGDGPPLVLLVPHHGSRSSSSEAFVAALAPRLAVVSAGWRNRFGHPHPAVVQRYADAGVALESTARSGALEIEFGRDAAPRLIARERERRARHWRE